MRSNRASFSMLASQEENADILWISTTRTSISVATRMCQSARNVNFGASMYSRDRLLLALRVLSAVTYDDRCDDRDLTELRHLAECEQERQLPLDDLACAVIWREIRVCRALNTQPAGVFS